MFALGRRQFLGWLAGTSGAALLSCSSAGCGSSAGGAPKPEAQDRINKLLQLYRAYVDRNKKGPPNEQALREFGQKLTSQERTDLLIGEDLEGIFTSPRDNEKFVVKYNVRLDPAQNRAIAYEAKGQNGLRYVALSIGYIVEYDEEQLKDYKK
jgi:hypothetical protein